MAVTAVRPGMLFQDGGGRRYAPGDGGGRRYAPVRKRFAVTCAALQQAIIKLQDMTRNLRKKPPKSKNGIIKGGPIAKAIRVELARQEMR